MKKLLLSLIASAILLRADFDAHRWQTRRPIVIDGDRAVSTIVVSPEVYKSSKAQLRDIRIVNGGAEMPYWIEMLSPSERHFALQPRLLDKAVRAGVGVHAVLDLGDQSQKRPELHNRLTIVTRQSNFRETVRIETSDDGRHWDFVRADGVIVDVERADRNVSDCTVEYPESTRRYVRVTVPGWSDPSYLDSVLLTYSTQIPAVRDTLATAVPSIEQDKQEQRTLATIDVGYAGLAFAELKLTVKPGYFSRNVEVSTGSDGKEWIFAGEKTITRTASEEELSIRVSPSWNRYVRLVVHNGDSPPIDIPKVELIADRCLIHFASKASGPYWLYLGNAESKQPSYDIATIDTDTNRTPSASLGSEKQNAEYRSAANAEGGHSTLLTMLLVAAVIAMGLVTVQMMKRVKAA